MKNFLIGLAVAVAALILASPFAGNFIDEDRIKPATLSAFQETAKELHMTVTSTITLYTFNSFFHNTMYMRAKGIPELHIHIYSLGGGVLDMIGILDMLDDLKADGFKIVTYARGVAASAAVPIFLMGDTRIISKTTQLMLHPIGGMPSEDQVNADTWRLFQSWIDRYTQILVDVTELSEASARNMVSVGDGAVDTIWFNAEEALDYGFATEIR